MKWNWALKGWPRFIYDTALLAPLERRFLLASCLVRRWGRIVARGQRLVHYFQREEEAVELFLALLKQKRSRGYTLKPHSGQKTIA